MVSTFWVLTTGVNPFSFALFFNSNVDIVRPPYPIAFERLYICASNLSSVSNYKLAIMCMLDNSFLSREQATLQTFDSQTHGNMCNTDYRFCACCSFQCAMCNVLYPQCANV